MTLKEKIEFIRRAQVYREEIEDKLGDIFRDWVGRLVVDECNLYVKSEGNVYYDYPTEYYIPIDEFIEKVGKKNEDVQGND